MKSETMLAEFVNYREDKAICWVEIQKGTRVKTAVPKYFVEHLNLQCGDEFELDLEGSTAHPIQWDESVLAARQQRMAELEKEFARLQLQHRLFSLEENRMLVIPNPWVDVEGMLEQGIIDADYHDLKKAFGGVHDSCDGLIRWRFDTPAGAATIYCYRNDTWYVGGYTPEVVTWMKAAFKVYLEQA